MIGFLLKLKKKKLISKDPEEEEKREKEKQKEDEKYLALLKIEYPILHEIKDLTLYEAKDRLKYVMSVMPCPNLSELMCNTCGAAGSYDLRDGTYFCSYCGTQR